MVKKNFISETIQSKSYWFAGSSSAFGKRKASLYLLPAFDEFIISYKDRTAVLQPENHTRAFTNNGIFHPAIVMNGKVIGLWKRNIQKDKVIFEAEFFEKANKTSKVLIEKRFNVFGDFLEREAEIHYKK